MTNPPDVREHLYGIQAGSTEAVRLQELVLDARLARGLVTIVDSTATDAHVRRALVARARSVPEPGERCPAATTAARLRELHRHLDRGLPLAQLEITR